MLDIYLAGDAERISPEAPVPVVTVHTRRYDQRRGRVLLPADKGKVSVKYANGEVKTVRRSLLVSSSPKPRPGSEVFVPVRDTTERTNYVQLFGAIVQIMASTIAIIVVATK